MSFARRMKWLAIGDIPTPDEWEKLVRDAKNRLDELEEVKVENRALRRQIQVLEIRHEELRGRMLGWQKGFGEGVGRQLKRMDERIANLLESDDSSDCEMNRQCLEDLKALRKDVSALEKRVEFVEKFKPVIVKEATHTSQVDAGF